MGKKLKYRRVLKDLNKEGKITDSYYFKELKDMRVKETFLNKIRKIWNTQ